MDTLIIDSCVLLDAQNLRISSTKLVNLAIRMHKSDPWTDFRTGFGIELYAPTVHTFDYSGGEYIPKLFGSKRVLSSIKQVNIHSSDCMRLGEKPSILFNWLVEFANIESLTVNDDALTVLYILTLLLLFRLYL